MTNFKNAIILFLISMVPFVELRGAIPVGRAMDLPFWECVGISIIANMIPVPFIILFIRKIFNFFRRKNLFVNGIDWLEKRVMKKSEKVKKSEAVGLAIFVGIPLPGTGAWSGALLAALLDIRMKTAIPAIFAGIVIAGFLVGGVTYGSLKFLAWIL